MQRLPSTKDFEGTKYTLLESVELNDAVLHLATAISVVSVYLLCLLYEDNVRTVTSLEEFNPDPKKENEELHILLASGVATSPHYMPALEHIRDAIISPRNETLKSTTLTIDLVRSIALTDVLELFFSSVWPFCVLLEKSMEGEARRTKPDVRNAAQSFIMIIHSTLCLISLPQNVSIITPEESQFSIIGDFRENGVIAGIVNFCESYRNRGNSRNLISALRWSTIQLSRQIYKIGLFPHWRWRVGSKGKSEVMYIIGRIELMRIRLGGKKISQIDLFR